MGTLCTGPRDMSPAVVGMDRWKPARQEVPGSGQEARTAGAERVLWLLVVRCAHRSVAIITFTSPAVAFAFTAAVHGAVSSG